MEAPEHLLTFCLGDAWAVIGDDDFRRRDGKADSPAFSSMTHRVLHQVGEHLRQQRRVAGKRHAGRDVGGQHLAAFLGRRRVDLGDGFHDGREVHRAEAGALRAGFHLRDAQQRREDVEQPVGLGLGRGNGVRIRRSGGLVQTLAQAEDCRCGVTSLSPAMKTAVTAWLQAVVDGCR